MHLLDLVCRRKSGNVNVQRRSHHFSSSCKTMQKRNSHSWKFTNSFNKLNIHFSMMLLCLLKTLKYQKVPNMPYSVLSLLVITHIQNRRNNIEQLNEMSLRPVGVCVADKSLHFRTPILASNNSFSSFFFFR